MRRGFALIGRYAALALVGLVFMSPLIWLAGASVRPPERFYDYDFFPAIGDWSFENYRSLFREIPFGLYLINSVFVSGVTVVVQLLLSAMGGFALAKYEFRGRRLIMLLMLSTMVIPGEVLLAPQYQIIQTMD